MALDTNIAMGLRPMADPMEQFGRAMTLKQLAIPRANSVYPVPQAIRRL